jgi:hypothetical protein
MTYTRDDDCFSSALSSFSDLLGYNYWLNGDITYDNFIFAVKATIDAADFAKMMRTCYTQYGNEVQVGWMDYVTNLVVEEGSTKHELKADDST